MYSIDQYALWTGLIGGLALFLFGMNMMTDALKRAAGGSLRLILRALTRNRFLGVLFGAVATAIVNSSSATTVILVGFVSAGVLSMAQSISVIMGTNIGSTFTAQILAFNVSEFALPLIAVGFLVNSLATRAPWRDYGRVVLGFGLVFYGMALMSESMAPLRSYSPFTDLIASIASVGSAVLVGAIFTAVIQSSAATTGIVMVLAGQGLMSLEVAIAIALGANIGTCATAGFAAIGKPREAIRAALVHVLFNVAGVLIWIAFVPQLAELARFLSPSVEGLASGTGSLREVPRQIANAHTVFNIANTLLFIGFTSQIARLVEWLVPDRPVTADQLLPARFLDPSLLSTPALALDNTRLEIGRLGEYVLAMLQSSLPAAVSNSLRDLDALEEKDRAADGLHREILNYLGKISSEALSPKDARKLLRLVEVANDLEHIADRIATDIVTSAQKRIEAGARLQAVAIRPIEQLQRKVATALQESIQALVNNDDALAARVRAMKREVTSAAQVIELEGVRRLSSAPDAGLTGYVREVELIEILDGIFKLARRIARSQLEMSKSAHGESDDAQQAS
jgi:phosphate:Na+ symporter